MADSDSESEEHTISNQEVVDYYRAAANIVNGS